MDTDILKPNTGYLSIERPHATSSKGTSDQQGSSGIATPDLHKPHKYTEPISEGEEDEERDLAPARDEHKHTGLSDAAVAEAIAYRERTLKDRSEDVMAASSTNHGELKARILEEEENDADTEDEDGDGDEGTDERTPFLRGRSTSQAGPRPESDHRALSIDPLAPSSAFDQTLRERLRSEHARSDDEDAADPDDLEEQLSRPNGQADERVLVRDIRAPAGKRISVPVRIEPKVYFAAERTFLVSSSSE